MVNQIGFDRRCVPTDAAMSKTNSKKTYFISPPKTAYEKMLVEAFYPNYSPKTLQISVPKKQELEKPAPMRNNWQFPLKHDMCVDTPGFTDDFYYNNLDWGKYCIGLNLDKICYIFNVRSKDKDLTMCPMSKRSLSSVKWNPNGECIAYGDKCSKLVFFDAIVNKVSSEVQSVDKKKCIFSMDWRNTNELTLGTYGKILHYDLRSKSLAWQKEVKSPPEKGKNNVCSLRWHPGKNLLATGCNADLVHVYDTQGCLYNYTHNSGIKALSWLPQSSLLLSGGGTLDRILKVFNATTGQLVCESKPLKQQITSVQFLDNNVFALGLGHPPSSEDQRAGNIQFWEYNRDRCNLKWLSESNTQSGRILCISKKPDSSKLCTASANETLCFWEPKIVRDENQIINHEKKSPFLSYPSLR